MSYYRHRIDASSLSIERRAEIWNFISHNSDIHTVIPSNLGVFEVFLTEGDLQILDSPMLNGCAIKDLTQEIDT